MTQRTTMGGNAFKSDGSIFNWADSLAFMQEFNLTYETLMNGAAVLSIRQSALAVNQDHYFVLDIPEGKELILFSRSLDLTQGRYNVDAVVTAEPLDLAGTIEGAAAPLDKSRPLSMQTRLRLKQNVTGVTATVREFGFADTGTAQTGQARTAGSTGVEGVIKRLVGQSPLRIRGTGENPFTANLVFICWERDREVL